MVKILKNQPFKRKNGKSKHPFEPKPDRPAKPIGLTKKFIGFFSAPGDPDEQNKLIVEMVEWAYDNDNALDPDQFPIDKRISPMRFYNIASKNEYFAEGLVLVRYIISLRLKQLARDKKIDKDYLFQMLPIYHPEFREWKRERRLSIVDEEPRAQIQVNILPVPSSDKVPERK